MRGMTPYDMSPPPQGLLWSSCQCPHTNTLLLPYLFAGLVADAASLGLHWMYDQEALLGMLNEKAALPEPEFCPPANKYYTHEQGEFSPYGHELHAVLQSLADNGKVDGDILARDLAAYYTGQAAAKHYLNKSSKAVVEAVGDGKAYPDTALAGDAQANSFVKAPAVVALMSGTPGLTSALKTAKTNHGPTVG